MTELFLPEFILSVEFSWDAISLEVTCSGQNQCPEPLTCVENIDKRHLQLTRCEYKERNSLFQNFVSQSSKPGYTAMIMISCQSYMGSMIIYRISLLQIKERRKGKENSGNTLHEVQRLCFDVRNLRGVKMPGRMMTAIFCVFFFSKAQLRHEPPIASIRILDIIYPS